MPRKQRLLTPNAEMAVLVLLMLAALYDARTKQDGLTICILWLSKALYALAHGWARMRAGVVAAAGAAVRETRDAYREAI